MTYVDIRFSTDGGHTWSDWRTRPLGVVGKFANRVLARRLGQGRSWVLDFRVTDPVRADLIAASVQLEQGGA